MCRRGGIWFVVAAAITTAEAVVPVRAAEPGSDPARFEFWSGAQAFRDAWALYSGITAAPLGSVQADGVRLRFVGGYGAYSYTGTTATGSAPVEFKGSATFADALVGYHKQLGPLTLKVFAGVMAAEHETTPADPKTAIGGSGIGGKVVLEGWWTMSERAWSSLDLAWGTLHESYSARARLGWRIQPALSAGLEAGAAGNVECDIARGGLFVRYEWASGEVAVSGGLSNDKLLRELGGAGTAGASAPYATLTWLMRF